MLINFHPLACILNLTLLTVAISDIAMKTIDKRTPEIIEILTMLCIPTTILGVVSIGVYLFSLINEDFRGHLNMSNVRMITVCSLVFIPLLYFRWLQKIKHKNIINEKERWLKEKEDSLNDNLQYVVDNLLNEVPIFILSISDNHPYLEMRDIEEPLILMEEDFRMDHSSLSQNERLIFKQGYYRNILYDDVIDPEIGPLVGSIRRRDLDISKRARKIELI